MARQSRRRRKKHDGHEDGERWMVTYADMITLLLVFFIILYSMSSLQVDRFNALVNSLRSAFSGNAIVDQSMNPPTTNYTIPLDTQNQIKNSPSTQQQQQTSQQQQKKERASSQDKQQLDKLYAQLENYIKQNHLQADIELENIPAGVQVSVKAHILFDLGRADIKPQALPVLKKIGGIINSVSNQVSVQGFTDNYPIAPGGEFKSNWDLSGARAQNVMLFLINKEHVKPSRMSFVGYGQYHPLVKNDTEAHKAMNRRVNIVIERMAVSSGS